jgi:hypothetical protein
MEERMHISHKEFLPVEVQEANKPRGNEGFADNLLSNPAVLSGILSLTTGRKVDAPASGVAGSDYMKSIVKIGTPISSWDFNLCGINNKPE